MGAPKASWQYASSSTTRTGAEFETAHTTHKRRNAASHSQQTTLGYLRFKGIERHWMGAFQSRETTISKT
ncbi:hypothetical protein HC256_005909 [Beauveria bassiana]|nr:hypothetical protein HC256_005909 [Beauveria bassiana]